MRLSKRSRILLTAAAPLLFVIAFVLVIALYSNFHKPSEVDIMATGFAPQSIEITEGETIHFVNQSATMTQILCLGTDQRCNRTAIDPSVLASPGLRLAPHQTEDIVFGNDGTYYITSTTVRGVNLTVTVNAAI